MFAMGRASHLFLGGKVGGGGLAKEKQNARKEGEKVGTQGSVGKRLCKSHPFLGFV